MTVFQICLPNIGPGLLQAREDPNSRGGKDVPHLNPVTDFYKRLALDCSGQQIAVDLFLLNCQYCDLATLCMYSFKLFSLLLPNFLLLYIILFFFYYKLLKTITVNYEKVEIINKNSTL